MEFTRCLRCMKETASYPCPHCGYDPGTVPAQPHALRLGTILNGKYVVGAILGQGGFGITYIGWDLALESKVAIKEYFPSGQVVRSPENSLTLQWYTTPQAESARNAGREMFLKEARKMSRVGSIPQVVRVRDLFQENDTAYIVMDFVEGETLVAHLKKNGPLTWEQAQEIFLPAIRAMEQVHQEGLIHRDLSPDNLMLLPNGDVRILDLGAAKDLTINSGASSMQVAKGGFSPLEQYTQRGGSGTWSDVYAMAATMYYSLTGVLPPAAVDRVETDTTRWDLPALAALPKPVLDALKKGMAVFVKDRTQTMGALLSSLETRKPQGKTSQGKPKAKKEKRPVKGILAAVLLLALAIGGYVGYSAWQEAQHQALLRTGALAGSDSETASQPTETEETVPEETFDLSSYEGVPKPFEVYYDEDFSEAQAEVSSCTFYDLKNGQTKIVVELRAPEGLSIFAEGYTYTENSEEPEVHEFATSPGKTNGELQTVAFDVPTEELTGYFAVAVGESYEDIRMVIGINPEEQMMDVTAGNPIGQVQNHFVRLVENKNIYQVHSLTTQELDNGYVRFTMDLTAPEETRIMFEVFDTHDYSDNWTPLECINGEMSLEGRETFIWDVPRESLVSADYIRVELYRQGDTSFDYYDCFQISSDNWQ